METLSQQLYAFLVMMGAGSALGAVYDVFRVVRGIAGSRSWLAWLSDALYWAAAAPVVITLLLHANGGELRSYVVLGAALGAVLYFGLLSQYVLGGLRFAARAAGWLAALVMHAAWTVATWPVLLLRNAGFAWRARRGWPGGLVGAGRARPGSPGGMSGPWRLNWPWRSQLAWRKR